MKITGIKTSALGRKRLRLRITEIRRSTPQKRHLPKLPKGAPINLKTAKQYYVPLRKLKHHELLAVAVSVGITDFTKYGPNNDRCSLGQLTKADDLRKIWADEAKHFTPWLSESENLKILSRSLGLDLELQYTEKKVGPYRADVLCKNKIDGSVVVIENQIERTDHTHLGQILTYASNLSAGTVVWVAKKFTKEHRLALDWLNNVTPHHLKFYGVEIELWKIGGSAYAPRFNIISKPNNQGPQC